MPVGPTRRASARRSRDAAGGQRLGVFGGTFNPVHLAHLRCAEELAETLRLDRVLFIPSASPPHKKPAGLARAHHRLAMVRLAVTGNPRFQASAVEIERGGRSYSVDTLRHLRQRSSPAAEFFFLVGLDAFRELETWKEHAEIFSLAHVVVATRPPDVASPTRSLLPIAVRDRFCYDPSSEGFINRSGNRVLFRHVTALDISASAIRARLARGQSVRYLLPPAVHRYIAAHGLYAGRRRSV